MFLARFVDGPNKHTTSLVVVLGVAVAVSDELIQARILEAKTGVGVVV